MVTQFAVFKGLRLVVISWRAFPAATTFLFRVDQRIGKKKVCPILHDQAPMYILLTKIQLGTLILFLRNYAKSLYQSFLALTPIIVRDVS